MFTGIVQGIGRIISIVDTHEFRTYKVWLPEHISHHIQIGASIANNGCCLTVVGIDNNEVTFDLMVETLNKTNLGLLKVGDGVNIERAARFGDEIGGHLMSGHITTTTTITHIDQSENNTVVWFKLPNQLRSYILYKGFIGLNGCSLTVGEIKDDEFCVYLIPETLRQTLFGQCTVGDVINIEIDPQTQAIVETVQQILNNQSIKK